MATKRIVLWCCIVLLLASPVVAYQFFWEELMRMVGMQMNPAVMDHGAMVQNPAVKERVDFLHGQTLDESFFWLLDGQQYHNPGYKTNVLFGPEAMETLLSARCFLKVFQQFGELPREQAVETLHRFSEKAINDYDAVLSVLYHEDVVSFRHEDFVALRPEELIAKAASAQDVDTQLRGLDLRGKFLLESSVPNPAVDIRGAKNAIYTSMLLAASIGESELLVWLMDEAHRIADARVSGSLAKRDAPQPLPERARFGYSSSALEPDGILTILMYAFKRLGMDLKMDISLDVGDLDEKTILLYRWDANATHYDSSLIPPNPQDRVEQFVVYSFPTGHHPLADDKAREAVIDALMERLIR